MRQAPSGQWGACLSKSPLSPYIQQSGLVGTQVRDIATLIVDLGHHGRAVRTHAGQAKCWEGMCCLVDRQLLG